MIKTFGQKILRHNKNLPSSAYVLEVADILDMIKEIGDYTEYQEQERLARKTIEQFEMAVMYMNKCITFDPEKHDL
jgi:hypothetical protein